MTQATPRLIRRLARGLDFRIEKTEKAFRLVEYLGAVESHPDVKGQMVVKGGTALNVYRWDLPRLSEDADVNYIGALDRETFEERRPFFLDGMRAVARELGYDPVTKNEEQRATVELLRFRDVSGQTNQLRLEVSFLDRLALAQPERCKATAALEQDAHATVLAYEENLGGKLAALCQRGKARDFFDADVASRHLDGCSPARIHSYFLAHCLYEDLTMANANFETIPTPADWPTALQPMVKRSYREPVEIVHDRVTGFVRSLPTLDATQAEGLAALQRGEIDGIKGLLKNIPWRDEYLRNPAVLWRLQQRENGVLSRRRRPAAGIAPNL